MKGLLILSREFVVLANFFLEEQSSQWRMGLANWAGHEVRKDRIVVEKLVMAMVIQAPSGSFDSGTRDEAASPSRSG
jgi:hypothetical protein